jgi:3-oxoacyl-[acyl-carrier protein] reductase
MWAQSAVVKIEILNKNNFVHTRNEEAVTGVGDLTGKVILVTGAAQGIGEAAARLCAERGATVVLADWNEQQACKTFDALASKGHKVHLEVVNVARPESVQEMMAHVQAQFGRLDVLVCAAGIFRGTMQPPDELTVEDFEAVIDVNLKGVFFCTKYAMPLFDAAGQAVVIIVGSGAGVAGPSGSLAYGASKGGANGYGMTLARHIADRNVRVNVLCPGGIATELKLDIVAEQARRAGGDPVQARASAEHTLGSPDGVGKVIAFLASDEAAYVKGTMFTR